MFCTCHAYRKVPVRCHGTDGRLYGLLVGNLFLVLFHYFAVVSFPALVVGSFPVQSWSVLDAYTNAWQLARHITSRFNADSSAIRQRRGVERATRVSNDEILSASWVVRAFVANCRRGCSRAVMTIFQIRSHDFLLDLPRHSTVNFDFVNPCDYYSVISNAVYMTV